MNANTTSYHQLRERCFGPFWSVNGGSELNRAKINLFYHIRNSFRVEMLVLPFIENLQNGREEDCTTTRHSIVGLCAKYVERNVV